MSKLIMVVDDDPAMLYVISELLHRHNLPVFKTDCASIALSLVDVVQADLIIVDLMMPNIDGIQLCQMLRQNPQTADTPIIVFSMLDNKNNIERSLAAGATAFVSKRNLGDKLLTTIKEIL